MFILSLTGTLPTAQLYEYANYVVKPEIARAPGAGIIEVLSSDTREIEIVLDPAQADRSRSQRRRCRGRARSRRTRLQPVGRFAAVGQQHLALASGLWNNVHDIEQAPLLVQERSDRPRLRSSATVSHGCTRSHAARHR